MVRKSAGLKQREKEITVIAYTTVITNNIAKSAAFYDALLAEVGGKRIMEVNRVILWGGAEGAPFVLRCRARERAHQQLSAMAA